MKLQLAACSLKEYGRWSVAVTSGHLRELPSGLSLTRVCDPLVIYGGWKADLPLSKPNHNCSCEQVLDCLVAYAAPFRDLGFDETGTYLHSRPEWNPYWFEARLVHFPHQVQDDEREATVAEALAMLVMNPGLGTVSCLDPWLSDTPHEVYIFRTGQGSAIRIRKREWVANAFFHHRLRVKEDVPWHVPFPPRGIEEH